MVSDTPTVTVENSDSRVCQVGVTSSHVAYTVYSGNSKRLNSEQSLISEHFW